MDAPNEPNEASLERLAKPLALAERERLHLEADYERYDWRAHAAFNTADFYDLFGPTKTGRKGYVVGVGRSTTVLYDEPRRLTLVAGWLALSLLVGGQAAWTLRPFFGVRSIPGAETRFFLGSSPDYRGSTNFYEAVYDLVVRPPLSPDYVRRGRGWD